MTTRESVQWLWMSRNTSPKPISIRPKWHRISILTIRQHAQHRTGCQNILWPSRLRTRKIQIPKLWRRRRSIMRLQRKMQRRHFSPHTTSTPTTQPGGGEEKVHSSSSSGLGGISVSRTAISNSQLLRRGGETVKFDGGERIDVDDAGVEEMEV
jgi:hypothetical protein